MSTFGLETHHRLWLLGIGLLVVLVAVGIAVWFVFLRSTGTPFDLRQALRSYRDDPGSGAAGTGVRLPPGGVYRYRTTGGESLSVPGTARTFPASTEMVVRSGDHCADVTWEPLEQHIEGMALCRTGSGPLVMDSASTDETVAGTTTRQVITCPSTAVVLPTHATPGQRWHATCTTGGDPVALTGSVLGETSVRVGDRSVPAVHTRVTLGFQGPMTGTNPVDYWFATDGLLLEQRESVTIRQSVGPLGSVTYREHVSLTLASLAPGR